MRLGKRERAMRREAFKVRSDIVQSNLANMAAIREEARLTALRSSANPTRLRSKTHQGYADNLHTRTLGGPNTGSCKVDKRGA
jgi:hypothetical protein